MVVCCQSASRDVSFRVLRRPILREHLRVVVADHRTGTLIAAGFGGAIGRSTDGGQGFTEVPSASSRRIYGGCSAQGSFWLVGEAGLVLRSRNDGRSFAVERAPCRARLNCIVASPSGRLVAAGDGGTIIERRNESWIEVRHAHGDESGIRAITDLGDGDRLLAVGYDGLALEEGPSSSGTRPLWTRLPDTQTDAIYGLTNAGGALYGCGSFGSLLVSHDLGQTWQPLPTDTKAFLRSISFDGPFGVAAGLGTILVSGDGGQAWTVSLTNYPAQLLACVTLSHDRAVVAGEYGTLLSTTDGGRTWSDRSAGAAFPIAAIAWPAEGFVVAVGARGSVLRSTDGGASFAPGTTGTKDDLVALTFPDVTQGLVATEPGSILRTQDGAKTFSIASSPGNPPLRAILSVPGAVIAAGESGRVAISSDGGIMWEPGRSPGTARLTALAGGSPELPYWIAGERGILAHARKIGGAMLGVYTGTEHTLNAVATSGPYLYAAGDGGTLLSSASQGRGSSLGLATLPGAATLRGLAIAPDDPRRAIAVGDGGTLAITTDGGLTWSRAIVDPKVGLSCIAIRGRRAIVGGEGGCIYAVDSR